MLLAALLLRALIPVGFMPDVASLSNGVLKVIICSVNGAQALSIDKDGKPVNDGDRKQHEHACAFVGIASLALPAANNLPLPTIESRPSLNLPLLAVTLPPSRAGPPLGSRGPPLVT